MYPCILIAVEYAGYGFSFYISHRKKNPQKKCTFWSVKPKGALFFVQALKHRAFRKKSNHIKEKRLMFSEKECKKKDAEQNEGKRIFALAKTPAHLQAKTLAFFVCP